MPDGSPAAAVLLGEHLRGLRERSGLAMRAFVSKYGSSQTTISRYERGDRLPRKAYLDCLLGEVARRGNPPLTPEDAQATYTLYRKALGPRDGRNALLVEVFELELRNEQLAAQATGLYMEAADYRARAAELQARLAAGGVARPGEEEQLRRGGAELMRRRTELEAEQRSVQQRINQLEHLLPLDDGEDMAIAPPPPAVPLSVPPGQHPARQRRRGGVTQWILATALAAALALLAVILLRPQSPTASAQSRSTPPPPSAAPTASAAAPSVSASAGSNAAAASPSASTAGWTMQYRDTSITLPPVEGIGCQLASMDFDPPRGYEGEADPLSGNFDDLSVQTACFGTPANITSHANAWGTSSSQEPGPDQCLNDANRNGLPQNQPLAKITLGSAYCLVTRKQSLAWFKVTAKPGSQQQGLTVTATLWTQPNA